MNNIDTVGARIRKRRKAMKVSAEELAEKLNLSPSTIYRYEKGDIEKVSIEIVKPIAVLLNTTPEYLMGWDDNTTVSGGEQVFTGDISGTVTVTNNNADITSVEHGQKLALESSDALLKIQATGGDVRNEILDIAKKSYKVQLETLKEVRKLTSILSTQNEPAIDDNVVDEDLVAYNVYERLSAGTGATTYDDKDYDVVYFDKEISHDFASWIWGDSMEPAYQDGEVALIKETGFDYDGAVYAVVWDGQTYIKKVYREDDGLRLVSLNKKYRDKFASFDEEPRVIGLVVGHFMPIEK